MNENLNLVQILKNCPIGVMLYSPIFGQVEFVGIDTTVPMPIGVNRQVPYNAPKVFLRKVSFFVDGRYLKDYGDSECLLFPSKEQRDWSKFEIPVPDKSLVWGWNDCDIYQRTLRFYDAKNQACYSHFEGERGGLVYDHFEVYKGEEPEWAIKARRKLRD